MKCVTCSQASPWLPSSSVDSLLTDAMTPGAYTELAHLYALSAALGIVIMSYMRISSAISTFNPSRGTSLVAEFVPPVLHATPSCRCRPPCQCGCLTFSQTTLCSWRHLRVGGCRCRWRHRQWQSVHRLWCPSTLTVHRRRWWVLQIRRVSTTAMTSSATRTAADSSI